MRVRFEELAAHDRNRFVSGSAALDDWFRMRAGLDQRRGITTVYVALDDDDAVIGFYSLSAFAVSHDDLPAELSRKLPRYDVLPAILIGRLARSISVQGQGLGELLLHDALRRAVRAGTDVAALVVVVEAKDEMAAGFYRRFRFIPFASRPLRLFLPLATAAKLIT